MTEMNRNERTACYRALSEDELNAVAGGAATAAAPASQPSSGKVFEIEDFSFDIEQTL